MGSNGRDLAGGCSGVSEFEKDNEKIKTTDNTINGQRK
jgi:hypothetical protein